MWGCFYGYHRQAAWYLVFPTHVGVFLEGDQQPHRALSLPHACGGVSIITLFCFFAIQSSPRMWGCFLPLANGSPIKTVFPTHVGVFLFPHSSFLMRKGLPHACGGVSGWPDETFSSRWSSPRMWGCFSKFNKPYFIGIVFPTHVGVFLRKLYI